MDLRENRGRGIYLEICCLELTVLWVRCYYVLYGGPGTTTSLSLRRGKRRGGPMRGGRFRFFAIHNPLNYMKYWA